MLGGTVDAAGDKVVVCAPRFATNDSYCPKQGNGRLIKRIDVQKRIRKLKVKVNLGIST